MSQITEWEFTADVASQINEILKDRPELPFSEARCEERETGKIQRRDLTLWSRAKKRVITGEVKMPDKRDGRSPLNEAVVVDAHNKANAIGVKHFFTWNVNDCVLWNTFEEGKSIVERHIEFIRALPAPIAKSDELLQPRVKEQIKAFLENLLERCAAILSGEKPLEKLPLDETFVRVWELSLSPLVADTLHEINFRYEHNKQFHKDIDEWMRVGLGLNLSQKDELIIRQNLLDTAKQSCFVLANKIIFYKALRQRFNELPDFEINPQIVNDSELNQLIQRSFEKVKEITGDYETVFEVNFGDRLTLLSENSSELWEGFIKDIDKFDFTQLNYEVIGQIFERLFDPEERHKFGQHYTRSEVVDLINAFCIRKPEAKVLDPSCGGGTFLVRAYQRKKDLSDGKLSHQDLIGQIYGTDISAYPVHLTTINLATRDLKEGANYPLVARRDFLKTKLGDKLFNVPNEAGACFEPLPKIDAIVGNPPYIRQEKITEYYGKNYKNLLQETVKKDAPQTELSGRSDLLCYFFTHGFALLADDGYIGLLTSSNWLDTAYGFDLQKFLLENFEIVAVFESNCEPWFTGARVTTAATILRKQPDAARRSANNVKFVWLKKPIADFVSYSKGDETQRRATFEKIREKIENLTAEEENETWRVRVVNQAELFQAGCLSFDVQTEDEDESDENETGKSAAIIATQTNFIGKPEQPALQILSVPPASAGGSAATKNPPANAGGTDLRAEYKGYKWGIFLRAPAIFNKLLKRGGERFVPLGQIADVKRGVTSGCDAFFFPRDVTAEKLAENLSDAEFKKRYGITKKETEKIRIVHAGDKSQHLIEAEFLEPEIHTVLGLDSVEIITEILKQKVLLVNKNKTELKGKRVLKYIEYGEREKFHEIQTVKNRAKAGKNWYNITQIERSDIVWAKAHQYRHLVWLNQDKLIVNNRMYDVFIPPRANARVYCSVLNSTIVALIKNFFGRPVGKEGYLETSVLDARMMVIPDPQAASSEISIKLELAFDSMRKRKALPMVDVDSTDEENWTGELALADRQALDDAVLELIGIADASERRELRDELYREITKLYRQIRITEKKAQKNRSQTAGKGKQTARSIAEEIWSELKPAPAFLTPLSFVPATAETETVNLPPGKAKIITQGLLGTSDVQIGGEYVALGSAERSELVKKLADLSIHGEIKIPVSPEISQKAFAKYEKEVENLNETFYREAATFTADENMQEKIVKELWKKLRNG